MYLHDNPDVIFFPELLPRPCFDVVVHLRSISSTFYANVFCTKVLSYFRQSQNVAKEKPCEALSYEKGAGRTLMKIDTLTMPKVAIRSSVRGPPGVGSSPIVANIGVSDAHGGKSPAATSPLVDACDELETSPIFVAGVDEESVDDG